VTAARASGQQSSRPSQTMRPLRRLARLATDLRPELAENSASRSRGHYPRPDSRSSAAAGSTVGATMRVLAISGSMRKESKNSGLLRACAKAAPDGARLPATACMLASAETGGEHQ